MIYKDFKDLKLPALGFGAMRLPVIDGKDDQIVFSLPRHNGSAFDRVDELLAVDVDADFMVLRKNIPVTDEFSFKKADDDLRVRNVHNAALVIERQTNGIRVRDVHQDFVDFVEDSGAYDDLFAIERRDGASRDSHPEAVQRHHIHSSLVELH